MSSPSIELLASDGAAATVQLFGAHVTSWRPAPDGEERLYLSSRSDMSGRSAIRGGIPVIFPQFAAEGPLPRHGFARTAEWSLADQHIDGDEAVASFALAASPATRDIWNAEFRAVVTVRVGANRMAVSLSVENSGDVEFNFAAALHTYLAVRDVEQAEVVGLHGARYRVSGSPGQLFFDSDETIRISGEIDRVYVDAPPHVTLREPERELLIDAEGFPDLVLWNPGARGDALPDLDPGGARRMLCIEAAAVHRPVVLGPERRWSGTQTLTAPIVQTAPNP